ncbi:hypothetical protein Pla123a_04800 [Posidoniimonas polymericola]|uniref:Uncharacterized protein n=1 Tax=Posidoniimonas polymericola TaxID=2528002 RepID=A0A5C5ZGI7_9BACT|nr:hypothetical protein Pla123a_04800 [Posidoniimonas polymericola]
MLNLMVGLLNDGCSLWKPTPTLTGPAPKLIKLNLFWRTRVGRLRKALGGVKQVHRANLRRYDPVINLVGGKLKHISPNIASNNRGTVLPS